MNAPTVLSHPYRTIEPFEDFLARVKWLFEARVKSTFGAMYLDELDQPGPEHAWLVAGWLSLGGIAVLAGSSKAGKSFWALELAMRIAHGHPLFGLTTKRGLVIYQAGEGVLAVKKRLRAWRERFGIEYTRETPFVLLQKSIDIYRNDELLDALIEEINAHAAVNGQPLRLVIVDTLATATVGSDENAGKDMSVVMANVKRIREKTGAGVLLVHHLNADKTKVRGHTSLYANADEVLLLSRDETTRIRTLKLDKNKDGEEGLELLFEMPSVVLGYDEDGKEVSSCVCIALSEREAVRREEQLKGAYLSVANELFMRAFFDAEKRYGIPVPPEMQLPSRVRSIVPWEDVKKVYGDMSPSDAITPEQQTTEEQARSDLRHREVLKKRTRGIREALANAEVLGHTELDGRAICWYTGKPLRAFPHTQPPPTTNDDPAHEIPF